MYPTIVHYGYAPPPYFDQNCPQCLQEHQALVFNNRAASTLNPLAKEFVPGQAFDPTGRDTTIGTANHHYCDDDKNSSDAVLLVNDTDAFPRLSRVQASKIDPEIGYDAACQTTSLRDNTGKKATPESNNLSDKAKTPLSAPIASTSAVNKIRKVSRVASTNTEAKGSVQTTAVKAKAVPGDAIMSTRSTPATHKKIPGKDATVKTIVPRETPINDIPPASEKTLIQIAASEVVPLQVVNSNPLAAPTASKKNAPTSTNQIGLLKPQRTEPTQPKALASENNTEKKVTLASIVARTVATSVSQNTGRQNTNLSIARVPGTTATSASKIRTSEVVRLHEVKDAFDNLKRNPIQAEAQFRALLKVSTNPRWLISNLSEGLARSLLRQGWQRWTEAENILRGLQKKFTDDTPVKHMIAVNLTLAHVLINANKQIESQTLLLRTMQWVDPERINMDEQAALVTPSGHQRLDQAMVRAHVGRGYYHKARDLLLSIMADLRPRSQLGLPEEERIRTPCGDDELDVLMCRILEKQQCFAAAETMLLALMRKWPTKRQKRLPSNPVSPMPCADLTLNLNLFRLLSECDKDHQARLFILQAMALVEPARYRLSEDQALLTPCSDHKLNTMLVRQLQKECHRTAAIHLLTTVMQASDKNTAGAGIAPCDDSDLNLTMLNLLSDEHRLAEAEAFLLQIMDSYRPKNQHDLPRNKAITTPCGWDSWDLAMVQLLTRQKNLPAAETLMGNIVAQRRPTHQSTVPPSVALVTPCGNQKLDLQMARVLCQRDKYPEAESLLLVLMNACRGQPQTDLSREEVLVTACGNNDVDMAMVLTQQEQGNFDTAITLMLSSMATHRLRRQREQLSREQAMRTPCLRHEHNMALLRLLSSAGKDDDARQLLQEIVALNCPNSENGLLSDAPCRHIEVDRVAVIILLEMNEQEKSINLLLAMMKAHRPGSQQNLPYNQALITPCQHQPLNQMLVTVLSRRTQTRAAAEQLLLAMMKSCPLNPRITIASDQLRLTPCNNYTMNMSLIMLHSWQGDTKAAKKLLLATMNLYRRSEQLELPERLAQITPCHQHELDLTMVRILTTEHRYQEAKALLLAMMGIDPKAPVTVTAHGPCGSPILDMAMLRLLAIARQEEQHSELLGACQERYPEDADFLAIRLMNLCRQCKWVEFDRQVAGLRPKTQHDLLVSIRYFNEALHCYLGKDRITGKALCTNAYQIAERALQRSPQNSLLLSHKAHCARILGHPPKDYLPLFERARVLNPDGEQTEKDDHWRRMENKVIKLLGV